MRIPSINKITFPIKRTVQVTAFAVPLMGSFQSCSPMMYGSTAPSADIDAPHHNTVRSKEEIGPNHPKHFKLYDTHKQTRERRKADERMKDKNK